MDNPTMNELTVEEIEANLARAEEDWQRAYGELVRLEEEARRWQAIALLRRQRPEGHVAPHVRIEGRPGPTWKAGGDLDYYEEVTVVEGDGSTLFGTFRPGMSPMPLLALVPGASKEVWGQAIEIEAAVRRVGGRADVVGRR